MVAVPGGFYVAYVSDEDSGPDVHEVLLMQGFSTDGSPTGPQTLIAESFDFSFTSLEMVT